MVIILGGSCLELTTRSVVGRTCTLVSLDVSDGDVCRVKKAYIFLNYGVKRLLACHFVRKSCGPQVDKNLASFQGVRDLIFLREEFLFLFI